jgi:hypothetical protein
MVELGTRSSCFRPVIGTVLHATKTKAAIIITLAFHLKDFITALSL